MVLTELIFLQFQDWGVCDGLKRTDFFTVSILAWCGDLKRTDFLTVSIMGGFGDLERIDF